MDLGLTGRAALVAAGTSGLGLGTAVALAREGADVALADATRYGWPPRPRRWTPLVPAGCSPRRSTSRRNRRRGLGRHHSDRTRGLHVVVTNGAGPPPGTVTEFELAEYRRALETSLLPHIGLALAHCRTCGRRAGAGY